MSQEHFGDQRLIIHYCKHDFLSLVVRPKTFLRENNQTLREIARSHYRGAAFMPAKSHHRKLLRHSLKLPSRWNEINLLSPARRHRTQRTWTRQIESCLRFRLVTAWASSAKQIISRLPCLPFIRAYNCLTIRHDFPSFPTPLSFSENFAFSLFPCANVLHVSHRRNWHSLRKVFLDVSFTWNGEQRRTVMGGWRRP